MQADNRTRVRVDIFGTEYTMRGDASADDLRAVAKEVDSLMRTIAAANPQLDQRRLAVLAALNMADEVRKLRKECDELRAMLDELTTNGSEGAEDRVPVSGTGAGTRR
ncbi:MAG: cell division protein ZapA [Alicyclobacillus sp.]|nr:cell division protein ZapA [Alicyclobacillus sp.]